MDNQTIIIIDLKAFYASIECADRNLNPFITPLVVTDISRGPGSMILSVTPYLKQLGIPSRLRLYELPKGDYVYATPRMERYLEIHNLIIDKVLQYINYDDIHIYSIDEFFINAAPYLKLYNVNDMGFANLIIKIIYDNFSLVACAGIGPNMFLAKCALDLEAKHTSTRIAKWGLNEVKTKLHKVTPLSKMWSISSRLEKRLNNLGLFTIGDIANCPVEVLKSKLGVIGEELHNLANGIDLANIREKYIPETSSISVGQTFAKDYYKKDLKILIREMLDDACAELRYKKKFCNVIKLNVCYSKIVKAKPINKQLTLNIPTDNIDTIYEAYLTLLDYVSEHTAIRKLSITLANLYQPSYEQLDLLTDIDKKEKDRRLLEAIIKIKDKYGDNAILRTDSLSDSSTIKNRHKMIGGHRK